MKIHISRVVSICYYHLRHLRQLQHCLSQSTLIMLVTSLILQRLDYCNSVLAGLPASSIKPLQRVQNATARLVLNLDYWVHITPALQQLRWLPVHYKTRYKIATLMHHIYNSTAPTYLCDLISFSSTRSLRSTTSGAATVQRTRTRLGDCAFSIAGPRVWNKLPASRRQTVSAATFKRQLKTYFFSCAFHSENYTAYGFIYMYFIVVMRSRPLFLGMLRTTNPSFDLI